MDYEGGDLLLAGAACGRLLGHCHRPGLCLQALGCDLKTAWRLSFSDEKRVRGVSLYTRRAIHIDVTVLPYLTLQEECPLQDIILVTPAQMRCGEKINVYAILMATVPAWGGCCSQRL